MHDNRTPQEQVQAFDRRQGGNSITIGGWKVYANGARRDVNWMGALIDPPKEDLERWPIQMQYHQKLQDTATKEFIALKSHLKALVMNGGSPDGSQIDQLATLQKQVFKHRKDAEEFQEKINNHPITKRRHQLREEDEAIRTMFLSKIDSVEI